MEVLMSDVDNANTLYDQLQIAMKALRSIADFDNFCYDTQPLITAQEAIDKITEIEPSNVAGPEPVCKHELFTGTPGSVMKCGNCGHTWLDKGFQPVENDNK